MTISKPKVVVIVGPTASGKTGLSIAIAKEFDGEIISADSRQVYRGLDIGTAKATGAEMAGITHHLIDVADIDKVYNAADFRNDATDAIRDMISRGKLPIIAGGTFFYVDTLLGRISTPEVAPNPALRAELEKLETEELAERLKSLDSERLDNIDKENPRRLIRAIEIASSLGAVPPPQALPCPYDVLILGIKIEKEELREKFRQRAEHWLEAGITNEVQSLLEKGITRERLREIGFEYLLTLDLIDEKLTKEEFIQKSIEKNWQYARRQIMWLKRDESIEWFDKGDNEIIERIGKFLG